MRKFSMSLAAAALAILVVACGGGAAGPSDGATSTGGTAIALKMEDIKYDTVALTATAGQALTLSLSNAGALEHDFTIERIAGSGTFAGKDTKEMGRAIHAHLKPKGRGTLTFTATETGTFEYFCSEPGHREAGMKGVLAVK